MNDIIEARSMWLHGHEEAFDAPKNATLVEFTNCASERTLGTHLGPHWNKLYILTS